MADYGPCGTPRFQSILKSALRPFSARPRRHWTTTSSSATRGIRDDYDLDHLRDRYCAGSNPTTGSLLHDSHPSALPGRSWPRQVRSPHIIPVHREGDRRRSGQPDVRNDQ